jgi:excisionase family DNA binding protein
MPTKNEFFNVREAAERLGLSEITIRRCMARGEIGFIRLGSKRGKVFFTSQHLADYLRRREVPAIAA